MSLKEINFNVGSKNKAVDFVKGIAKKDKVAILSHIDLDGMGGAKVLSKVVKYDLMKFLAYEQINNDLVKELKKNKITKVIISDLSIDNVEIISEIEDFAEILIIDHHLFEQDFNSERIVFVNSQDYCATYLCYYLFSEFTVVEELDWLVVCACIADWQYFNNQKFMSEIMKKYGDSFEVNEDSIRKSGKFWDLQLKLGLTLIYFGYRLNEAFDLIDDDFSSMDNLDKYCDEINEEIESSVKKFEKEKEIFGDVYLWIFSGKFQIKGILSTIISVKYPNKTIIIVKKNQDFYTFSARRQDKKINVSELLKNAIEGFENAFAGGHIPAAGGQILHKDIEKFRKNLKKLA